MNFLSLFAGIGGIDLGLIRAGWTCAGQVECDPFCIEVLKARFPGAQLTIGGEPRWVRVSGEIRRWTYIQHLLKELRDGLLFPVDAVAGGFPCQDISVAGKGKGLKGRRSRFWFAMLETVRHLRPRVILIENVPALRTRGADTVLAGLEAAGYSPEACVVGAEHVHAPHRRHRVWIVAHADSGRGGEDQLHSELRATRIIESSVDPRLLRVSTETVQVPRWPARPGEPQHEWEHPRLIDFWERLANPGCEHGVGGGTVPVGEASGGIALEGTGGSLCESGAQSSGPVRDFHCRSGAGNSTGCNGRNWSGGNECIELAYSDGRDLRDKPRGRGGKDGPGAAQSEHNGEHSGRRTERRVGAPIDGVSRRLVRLARLHNRNTLKAVGNSVVPEIVEVIGRAILASEGRAVA